jgi:hypothetical protein
VILEQVRPLLPQQLEVVLEEGVAAFPMVHELLPELGGVGYSCCSGGLPQLAAGGSRVLHSHARVGLGLRLRRLLWLVPQGPPQAHETSSGERTAVTAGEQGML